MNLEDLLTHGIMKRYLAQVHYFFSSPKHAYSDEIELFIMPADSDCVFKDNRIKVLALCICLLFRDRSQGTFSLFDFAACHKRDF